MAIFVLTTTATRPIALPLAHARGVTRDMPIFVLTTTITLPLAHARGVNMHGIVALNLYNG